MKTAIASKQLGCEGPLAKLVAEACVQVMPPVPSKFDVDNVRVTKVQGGNLNSSFVVEGMAIARRSTGVEQFKEKTKARPTVKTSWSSQAIVHEPTTPLNPHLPV